jgi:hypothetical protein
MADMAGGRWVSENVWVPDDRGGTEGVGDTSCSGCRIMLSWCGLGCLCPRPAPPSAAEIVELERVHAERKREDGVKAQRLAVESKEQAADAAATRPPGVIGCKNYASNPYHTCNDFCRQNSDVE